MEDFQKIIKSIEEKINILETKNMKNLIQIVYHLLPQQLMADRDIEREKLIKDNKLNETFKTRMEQKIERRKARIYFKNLLNQ